MEYSTNGFSKAALSLAVLLVLIAAAAASLGTYTWQHNHVNNLNSRISDLNSKVSNLNNQLSVLSGQINKTCPQTQQTDTNPVCEGYRYTSENGVSILVFSPAKNEAIGNPVSVMGEVPGNWSFEAQFPVQLKNSKGNVVAQVPAHLLGNWETSKLVPFSAQLTYTTAETGNGAVILQKDNPSGLQKNSDSVTIPISFK